MIPTAFYFPAEEKKIQLICADKIFKWVPRNFLKLDGSQDI